MSVMTRRWAVMLVLAVAVCGLVFAQDEAEFVSVAAGTADTAVVIEVAEEVHPLVQRFEEGGRIMWVLTLLSMAGVAFAVERVMQLRRDLVAPEGLRAKADQLWKENKADEIPELCAKQPSTLGRIIAFVAEHRQNSMTSLNESAGDIARREFRKHQRRAYPLAVVGTLSPLLGLMGTVFGLMESFEAVAVAGTMDDPSILANSIAKALVTTATGLIIAVPALLAYHFFKNRTGDLLDILDEEVSMTMNSWFLK